MVVAVVAIIVVVAALALGGVFSPAKSSSSSGASGQTYGQAASDANGVAQSTSGGSWSLVLGAGVMTTATASESLGSGSGCNVTYSSGVSSTITVPASTEQTNGQATGWLFLYRDAAETYLLVTVIGGQASAIGTIAAKEDCAELFDFFSVVPSDVIDSSAAASAVAGYAGAFLAAHADANASYTLFGGASFLGRSIGPEWFVNYTTCPVNPPDGSFGAAFNASVNATSGAVIFEQSVPSVSCSFATNIGFDRSGTSPSPTEIGAPSIPVVRRN